MPVKKMTPESCNSTDAGTMSKAILSRQKRRLKRRFKNAVLIGTFATAMFLMFLAVFCSEIWMLKSLLIFLPCAAWAVLFWHVNADQLEGRA